MERSLLDKVTTSITSKFPETKYMITANFTHNENATVYDFAE